MLAAHLMLAASHYHFHVSKKGSGGLGLLFIILFIWYLIVRSPKIPPGQ